MLRLLHLAHRYLGIALCLMFTLWFASGYLMMYVRFPSLTPEERHVHLPALNLSAYSRAAELPSALTSLELTQQLDRPVFSFTTTGSDEPRLLYADTLQPLPFVEPETALAIVRDWLGKTHASVPALTHAALTDYDQWTVSHSLHAHRPLHRIEVDDAARTHLYISSRTGEVVRDTTRRERLLNYIGAVIHWIYPTFLRKHPEAWNTTVQILAGFGTALALSGIAVGFLRFRRKRRATHAPRSEKPSPKRWHYRLGVLFGLTTFTWVFSGWMSMNPFQLNPPTSPSSAEKLALAQAASLTPAQLRPPASALTVADIVAARWFVFAGQPCLRLSHRDHRVTMHPAEGEADKLLAQLPSLVGGLLSTPSAPVLETLTTYDTYYYSRATPDPARPLPALRVRFGDSEETWFHLNPATGEVLERLTARNRLFRHLYHGLHSFDWWWLYSRRPLWDIVVLTFNTGGLALSLLGLRLAYLRLNPRPTTP